MSKQSTAATKRALETALQRDRKFFEANPHRSYRLRPLTDAELRELLTSEPHLAELPPGFVLRAAVCMMRSGIRARIIGQTREEILTPASEEVARRYFETWVGATFAEGDPVKVILGEGLDI